MERTLDPDDHLKKSYSHQASARALPAPATAMVTSGSAGDLRQRKTSTLSKSPAATNRELLSLNTAEDDGFDGSRVQAMRNLLRRDGEGDEDWGENAAST